MDGVSCGGRPVFEQCYAVQKRQLQIMLILSCL